MREKRSQALEASVDALHPASFVGIGDLATDATLLINRRAADVAAEKDNTMSFISLAQVFRKVSS